MSPPARRCLLAVFAHPDDETSAAAGTLIHYAREGVDIHVVTATRGERGDLGTGDLTIARRDLPAVREAELRAVLALYGAHPPILLDYRDQELITADFATLTQDVLRVMASVRPEVVITFGPSGISGHEDHKTIHRAATEAFHRYRPTAVVAPRLYYVALPPEVAAQFAFAPASLGDDPLRLYGYCRGEAHETARPAHCIAPRRTPRNWRCSLRPINSIMNGFIRRILCSPQRRRQHADCGLRSHHSTYGH